MDKKVVIEHFLQEIRSENSGDSLDILIPGYASKKIEGYMSMREGLLMCLKCIETMPSVNDNKVISAALFHTVIMLYGKAFTDASHFGYPKLEPSDCFKEKEDLKEIHQHLMELRHNFVAHRGKTENEHSFPFLKIYLKDNACMIRIKQIKRAKPKDTNIEGYICLITHLISLIEVKMQKCADKVYRHLLDNYTAEEWAFFKIAGPINKEVINKSK